jgi:hypothetical protein
MKTTHTLIAIAAAVFALNAGAADAQLYGKPAPASAAQRKIEIKPDSKNIRVTNGETVTFSIDGKPFTWTFQLYQQEGVVALAAILPQELHADGVKVYVDADPTYR